jgi:hypothetical protein
MSHLTHISIQGIEDLIKKDFSKLTFKNTSINEITITNPKRTHQGIIIKIPHGGTKLEGIAFWADSKQIITESNGIGEVEDISRWQDEGEAVKWNVSFDTWLNKWLQLLNSNASGPIRPTDS